MYILQDAICLSTVLLSEECWKDFVVQWWLAVNCRPSRSYFGGVYFTRSLVFCIVFYRSLFVPFSFSIWQLSVILQFTEGAQVAQWVRSLDLTTHASLSSMWRGFAPDFVNYKKGSMDSQPQVIKFTSCLPMEGGSLRVLRLLPPLKLVAMI